MRGLTGLILIFLKLVPLSSLISDVQFRISTLQKPDFPEEDVNRMTDSTRRLDILIRFNALNFLTLFFNALKRDKEKKP